MLARETALKVLPSRTTRVNVIKMRSQYSIFMVQTGESYLATCLIFIIKPGKNIKFIMYIDSFAQSGDFQNIHST